MVQLGEIKGNAVGRKKKNKTETSEKGNHSLSTTPSSNHTRSISLHASPAGILLTNRYMPKEAPLGGNANGHPVSDPSSSRERTPQHGTLPRLLPIQTASGAPVPFPQQRPSNFDFSNNSDISAHTKEQMWAAIFDLQRRVAYLETLVFDNSTSERSKSTLNSFTTSPVTLTSRSNHTTPEGDVEVGKGAGATLVN